MKTRCNAKINLSINVLNKNKPNGNHDLDMINIPVDLCDSIECRFEEGDDIIITSNDENLPTDSRNVCYKVAQKFKEQFNIKSKIIIYIEKNIPSEAGLGGGSSDATGLLNMLDKHFKTQMDDIQKIRFLYPISADSPFFVKNKTCRVKKGGDVFENVTNNIKSKILIVKPFGGCSTKEIYSSLDYKTMPRPNINKIAEAIEKNDIETLKSHVDNSLKDAAMQANDQIKDVLWRLACAGFEVVGLSGSGSACFAFSNKKAPYQTYKKIIDKKNYQLVKECNIIK